MKARSAADSRFFKININWPRVAWLVGAFCLLQIPDSSAQIYVETGSGTSTYDLCSCTEGAVIDPTPTYSIAADAGDNVYYLGGTLGDEVYQFNTGSGSTNFVAALPGGVAAVSMVYGPDGLIYASGTGFNGNPGETLFSVNPSTGAVLVLGDLPPEFTLQGDLFFFNGQLCGLAMDGSSAVSQIIQIPTGNPAGATVLQSLPGLMEMVGGISVIYDGAETVFTLGFEPATGDYGLYQIDMATGDYMLFCSGLAAGDLAAPPNYVVPACCSNNAGNLSALDPMLACQNEPIVLQHLGDEALNPGAALSFVLVADSAAALPSAIVQVSANPIFTFDPATMSLNQPYFVAAVAAPGPAGSPDWASTCLDLSFFAPVEWKPLPTLLFSIANAEVCAGDCLDFLVNFTGAPPFELTFENPFTGQQSQVFPNDNGTIQVCPPAGTPAGNLSLQALALSDANCACP